MTQKTGLHRISDGCGEPIGLGALLKGIRRRMSSSPSASASGFHEGLFGQALSGASAQAWLIEWAREPLRTEADEQDLRRRHGGR